ncbi:hypothetical protein [Hyphomicrobium sp.]|uniref:hypothetical protein n=1 Tax=Hyphomicrobium sp. TaxID=82 RepID=UPI0025BF7FE7|nr:hypothetical protein [Hyphomicrobium sp.]MCC7254259.1 hypothetical protein [Hyphomicrobium sp.]
MTSTRRSQAFTLTPGQHFQSPGLSMYAQSCVIDNPTAQWWKLPDGRRVKPFTINNVFSFAGTQVFALRAEVPTGIIANAEVSDAVGSIIFFESALPELQGLDMGSNYVSDPTQSDMSTVFQQNIVFAAGVMNLALAAPFATKRFYMTRFAFGAEVGVAVGHRLGFARFILPTSIEGLTVVGTNGGSVDFGPNPVLVPSGLFTIVFEWQFSIAGEAGWSITGYTK